VAVSDDDHDGSRVPDESPDSILSSEPKPLGKHRPPPPPSYIVSWRVILSPITQQALSIYGADKPIINPSIFGRSGSRTLSDLISGA
ncbi:hypothetical protein Tco_0357810, partial [Tanacetum coccineum]